MAVSALPSASSMASDRLLRAAGRFNVKTATSATSSRSRMSAGALAAWAAVAAWAFIGTDPVLSADWRLLPSIVSASSRLRERAGSRGRRMDIGKPKMAPAKLPRKELIARLRAAFPEMFHDGSGYDIEEVWHRGCRVRFRFHENSLRPGGTVHGPAMMA